jgi:beta-glucosidase
LQTVLRGRWGLAGPVPSQTIDAHVRTILATWFRYRLFDRAPYRNDDRQIDKPAHARDAQAIERQAMTLLRNQRGTLPLDVSRLHRIAVIAKDATQFVTGGGSGNVTPFRFTSLLEAARARGPARAGPDAMAGPRRRAARRPVPGGPGATAVAGVLFGDADPGGRLPVTFPASPDQIPTAGDPARYPGSGSTSTTAKACWSATAGMTRGTRRRRSRSASRRRASASRT